MAAKKPDFATASLEWCRLAGAGLEASGLERSKVAVDGLKGAQLWRAAGGKKGQQRPPLRTAWRLYEQIAKRRPDLRLPPPAVVIESAEQFEWAELGTRLMRADTERFSDLLERVRKIVAGVEAHSGMDPLVDAGGGGDRSE